MVLLADEAAGSTLCKFLDDCDADFIDFINKTDNSVYLNGMLMHKLKGDEVEMLAATVADDPLMTKVKKWVDRSKDVNKFLEKAAEGVFYSNRATKALLLKTDGLAEKLGINMDDYQLFKEVQLWVDKAKGEYMIGDIVLVKYNAEGKIIDIILLENKLSATTLPTIRQGQGFKVIENGGSLEVKSAADSKFLNGQSEFVKGNKSLNASDKLTFAKDKALKISDAGSKDGDFNISQLIK